MSEPAGRRISVLVVDDDGDLRESLRALLESFAYDVTCAEDSASALAAVAAQPPDVILTDIYMPGTDGFALINALRASAASIPVVAMSGGQRHTSYDHPSAAQHLGAFAVLDKPFRSAQLVETIERALAERRQGA